MSACPSLSFDTLPFATLLRGDVAFRDAELRAGFDTSEAWWMDGGMRGVVTVWTLASEAFSYPDATVRFAPWMTPEERARRDRFHFEAGRHAHQLARALSRSVLGRALGIAPSEVRFEVDALGKPHLAGAQAESGITFNLSHTEGQLALVVAQGRRVGVDVERMRQDRKLESLAERFFSAAEYEALRALEEPERVRRFYRLWTLKEAYLKARGTGLTTPLDQVELCFDADALSAVRFLPGLADDAAQWHFEERPASETCRLAVAVERPPGEPVQVDWERAEDLLQGAPQKF